MTQATHLDPLKLEVAQAIHQSFGAAFAAPSPDVDSIYELLEVPPDQTMGHYALPCFGFAKVLRMGPPKIAQDLQSALQKQQSPNDLISECVVLKAFLNFRLSGPEVAKRVLKSIASQEMFQTSPTKKRVMVEFSNPNTHKVFHVGHLRNACLGDSVVRLLRYAGNETIPVNYIGDEGAHVAKCLWEIQNHNQPIPTSNKMDWFGERYVAATQKLSSANEEQKKVYQGEISTVLSELESKSGSFYDLWQTTRQDCLKEFADVYNWLGVHFEHDFFESELTDECQSIVDEYIEKGLFVESNGAIGLDLEEHKLGFFLARKSDGTSLYITKDIALARKKFEMFHIDASVYVVASEQNFHFAQLFKILELMNFSEALNCHHLSYAMVRRPDGKMSSRLGNVYTLSQLRTVLMQELSTQLEKYKDSWSSEQLEETAKKLTLAAIKYGMLNADPGRDIIFDPKAWTAFEGNTGPYLIYGYARAQSILKKANYAPNKEADASLLLDEHEVQLLLHLNRFNEACRQASNQYRPSVLANYLYELVRAFNRFYSHVQVANTTDANLKQARLCLVENYANLLKRGLDLLGIEPVDQM